MLIKFNILWVEDDPKYVETTGNVIRTYLDKIGFHLVVDHIQDPKNDPVEKYLENTSKYDLILVDLNFKVSGKQPEPIGGEIIQRIRDSLHFADIIFYSGDAKLNNEFKEKGLQGVYLAKRIGLKEEAKDLIDYLLHKTLHPKIMRGVVVSELSNIDDICYQIIKTKYNHTSCDQGSFASDIKASLKAQIDSQYSGKDKIINKSDDVFIEKIQSTMVLDSHKRSLKVHELAEEDSIDVKMLTPISKLPEIVLKRNKIAHWKRVEETDEHILLTDGTKEYKFDQSEAAIIRIDINNAAIALNQYLELLSAQE